MKRFPLMSWSSIALAALLCASMAHAANPHVVIETSMGDVELELYEDKAPISVKNFLDYAKAGHYEGTLFHRVIPGFMIQGGGFDTKLTQKKTNAPIKNEANNGLKNERGTLAMARTSVVDSATSQFFINVVDNAFLNHQGPHNYGYAVFGRVVKGMDVVDKIAATPTGTCGPLPNCPTTQVVIKKVRPTGAAPATTKKAPASRSAK